MAEDDGVVIDEPEEEVEDDPVPEPDEQPVRARASAATVPATASEILEVRIVRLLRAFMQ
jgi:hypothetical protein